MIERLLGGGKSTMPPIIAIMKTLIGLSTDKTVESAREAIWILADQIQTGSISGDRLKTLERGSAITASSHFH